MNKCWFIWQASKHEGPFSYEDLKNNRSLTPDTLVWKEGMSGWKPIRNVPELKNLFKDEENDDEENEENLLGTVPQDEIALPLNDAEPPLLLWLLIAILVIIYTAVKLFQ